MEVTQKMFDSYSYHSSSLYIWAGVETYCQPAIASDSIYLICFNLYFFAYSAHIYPKRNFCSEFQNIKYSLKFYFEIFIVIQID